MIDLDDVAKKFIKEIKQEIKNAGYQKTDDILLIPMALNYQYLVQSKEDIEKNGLYLFNTKTGTRYLNPAYKCFSQSATQIGRLADRMGIGRLVRKKFDIKDEIKEKTVNDLLGK